MQDIQPYSALFGTLQTGSTRINSGYTQRTAVTVTSVNINIPTYVYTSTYMLVYGTYSVRVRTDSFSTEC